ITTTRRCARRSIARSSAPPMRRKPPRNLTQQRSAATSMPMPDRTLVQAVRDALYEEMERDDRVCVLGQDVGLKGGVFKATEGLQQRVGAPRGLGMPLAGWRIAAAGQGLALEVLL